ncbi:MAG: hypothetical protein JXA09_18130 [Anaerolineae bacterium]|nr:hypothetical protein [Anaerolineae bacterium]
MDSPVPENPVNDEPPVGRRAWLHRTLVALDRLSSLPPFCHVAAIGLLGAATGALWRALLPNGPWPWIAAACYALCAAGDWAWLAALPRWGLSYGPVAAPLLGMLVLRFSVGLAPLLALPIGASAPLLVVLAGALQLGVSGAEIYATGIEPFRLGVTQIVVHSAKLPPDACVRLVQVSDLHVERITRRERDVVARVNALRPDYLLLTGDYLSFSYTDDARAIADARQVLGALRARAGCYAVRGTHQVDPNALLPTLFAGLPVHWLRNAHAVEERDGYRLAFVGASCTRVPEIDVPALARAADGVPPDAFSVLLYHTPDLVPQAAAAGIDLYLAGHTHGGQIRLPLYGALLTATAAGKRHEMGRYDVAGLTLYVSRGIGMEGRGAPRARFLCPPEIVCIDVTGAPPARPAEPEVPVG